MTKKCFFVISIPVATHPLSSALIFTRYFSADKFATNARYRWDSASRGDTPFVILQWTLSGEGRYEDDRGIATVPKDHAFISIVPERSCYCYPPEAQEPWVFDWLNFHGRLSHQLFQALREEFGPVIPLASGGTASAALQRLIAAISKTKQSDRWQASRHAYDFILEWWREVEQPPASAEAGLERAIRFCREHFREQHGIKEIAAEAGMSREHFSRLFSERLKETPAAYLRRLRLVEATTLLDQTRLPLAEIAFRSGFYSTRHFLQAFQRTFNENPTARRRRMSRRKGVGKSVRTFPNPA